MGTNTTTTYHTKRGDGYIEKTNAVAPGQSTWAVLRSLKNKDRKNVLKWAQITVPDAGTDIIPAKITADVTSSAQSEGLPAVVCGSEVITYNTDDVEWFNITALDVESG